MLIIVLGVLALLCGYLFYSRLPEHMFMPFRDDTPAVSRTDGMDFVPQKRTKNLLIQFLNIAGTGPVFGTLMGAKWGPIVFEDVSSPNGGGFPIWIVVVIAIVVVALVAAIVLMKMGIIPDLLPKKQA